MPNLYASPSTSSRRSRSDRRGAAAAARARVVFRRFASLPAGGSDSFGGSGKSGAGEAETRIALGKPKAAAAVFVLAATVSLCGAAAGGVRAAAPFTAAIGAAAADQENGEGDQGLIRDLSLAAQSLSLLTQTDVYLRDRDAARIPTLKGEANGIGRAANFTSASVPTSLSADYTDTNNTATTDSITNSVALNGHMLTFTGTGNFSVSGVLSGSSASSVVKSGCGALTLSAANTFSGFTYLTGGSRVVANADALQNSTLYLGVNNGVSVSGISVVDLGGLYSGGSLSLGSAALNISASASRTTDYSGTISTSSSLQIYGAGTATLRGYGSTVGTYAIFDRGASVNLYSSPSTTPSLTTQAGYIGYTSGYSATVNVAGLSNSTTGAAWSTGSSNFYVGYKGTGTLNINSSGKVTAGTVFIGSETGGVGTVNIADTTYGVASSLVASGTVVVGESGTGTLNVSNGGQVSAPYAIVADAANSGHTSFLGVSNSGSLMTLSSGPLYAGEGGTGAVSLYSGGKIVSVGGYIGDLGGSVGNVTINGLDASGNYSTWNVGAHDVFVGKSGTGTLLLQNGGVFQNSGSGAISLGFSSGSTATLHIDGGKVTTDTITLGSGTVNPI